MELHHVRQGRGKPLLLIHGLGGSWRSWSPILNELAAEREVIAIDLPGHGETPSLPGELSVRTLADAVSDFLSASNLIGVDAAGSSLGAQLGLELARRGRLGAVVSLNPSGFCQGWERHFFYASIKVSVQLVRWLQPVLPLLVSNAVSRSLLFAQLSAHPWRLSPEVTLTEMRSFAAFPFFDQLLHHLAYTNQQGAPLGSINQPLVIGWGRQDRVCLSKQAERAIERFPDAKLHWFDDCGHFPQWDVPHETVRLILATTGTNTTGTNTIGTGISAYKNSGEGI